MKQQSPTRIPIALTEEEWKKAVEDSLRPTPDGEGWKTLQEIKEDTGMAVGRLYSAMQKLSKDGRLESKNITRLSINGHQRLIPAYRIKAAK